MSEALQAATPAEQPLEDIVGRSAEIRRMVDLARRFAPTNVPILIVGATGTGKELVARHVHAWSGRQGELVDVNCGTLPPELVESTLFGHRRGSFSGAHETTVGLVEAAHAGTLFLDELCSLSVAAQVKLLRVLETGTLRRVGETAKRSVDFRLVAASQERLESRVSSGLFREDLFHRIAGIVLDLPPLRLRGDDLLLLAETFAASSGRRLGTGAAEVLRRHAWPGNVRELRSAMARAEWLGEGETLSANCLAEAISLGGVGVMPGSDRFGERETLLAACDRHGWHATKVAASLGVSRTTLYRRLRDAGLSLRDRKRLLRVSFAAERN